VQLIFRALAGLSGRAYHALALCADASLLRESKFSILTVHFRAGSCSFGLLPDIGDVFLSRAGPLLFGRGSRPALAFSGDRLYKAFQRRRDELPFPGKRAEHSSVRGAQSRCRRFRSIAPRTLQPLF